MENSQLVDFIQKSLAQGTDVAAIKTSLVSEGWPEKDVDLALATLQKSQPVAAYAPYEEIDAKRTSTLGYFFLILMVIFGLWQGNNFLSALQDSITRPQENSQCLSVLNSYTNDGNSYGGYYYGYGNNIPASAQCNFSTREKESGVPALYEKVQPELLALAQSTKNVNDLNSQISQANYTRNQTISEYQVSLLETMAISQGKVFNRGALQTGISTGNDLIAQLSIMLAQEQSRQTEITARVRNLVKQGNTAIQDALDGYTHDYRIYQLEQFLLSLVLVAPLLFVTWKKYHSSREKRSEYAIIWGGLLATVSLLFAQIMLVFIYEVLPRGLIQELLSILAKVKFLWTLLYWLGFVLVPLFFGYLIYLIQKKYYNKAAVKMRALKSGVCPNCSLKVVPAMNHCPVCGYALKLKCGSCSAMSMNGAAFCESCGVKKNS